MFRNWTFRRKLGGGFAVTVLAIVAIAVTGYRSATSLMSADEWVSHTHEVQHQIDELLLHLVNAETGQRGFVITGNDEFLGPYNIGVTAVDRAFVTVRALTIDNPPQTRRLDELRPLIDAKLAELKERIELRRRAGFEPAAASIASGRGKQLMERIRGILGDMEQEESRLLDARRRVAAASSEMAKFVMVWGSIAAAVIAIVVGWLITSRLSKQIGSAVQHVQSSSAELQAAATQQANGARAQASALAAIAVTIQQLIVASRQIATGARKVSQIAGQTLAAARVGEVTVQKGHDASRTVRQQVDMAVHHMSELVKHAQQINSVLDIVAELAEQTNILAINASIEAVGAREVGARFAVVADEIRKLADRVREATKEIRRMIDLVRNAVATTMMSTEAGSKAVDLGTAQVQEMASAFAQIASFVGTTTDAAKEIELSTNQQASAVEQINGAVTSAAGASRETEASTTQTLETAAELQNLSTMLSRIIQAGRPSGSAAANGHHEGSRQHPS